jgi:hypothetical protein
MASTFVSDRERQRVRDRRRYFIRMAEEQGIQQGKCHLPMTTNTIDLDDPPQHPIMEMALQLHEFTTRGRFPDAPGTLYADLKKLVNLHDWKMENDRNGGVWILDPPVRMKCPYCQGNGRIVIWPEYSAIDWSSMEFHGQFICRQEICMRCHGFREIIARRPTGKIW